MEDQQGVAMRQARYWRRVLRVTGALLALWLVATLVGPWFARDLADVTVGSFPLSFWVASEGALLLYLAIIVTYAVVMDRLDAQFRQEGADPDHG